MINNKSIFYKLPFLYIFCLVVAFIISYLLVHYFTQIQNNLFLCICLFIFVILINIYSVIKFKIIWTPIFIYSIFIVAFIFYFLYLSKKQALLTNKTIFLIILSFIFFVLGFFSKRNITLKITHFKCSKEKCINFLFHLGILVFIAECIINRSLPILSTLTSNSNYGDFKLIPFFHYFIMLEVLLPLYYLQSGVNNKKNKVKVLLILFIVLNLESRQLIIFYFLSIFSSIFFKNINTSYKKINKYTIFFIIFLASLFIILGNIRVGSNDINDYLKAYSGVDKEKSVSLIDLWFNLYTTVNYSTFQNIIQKAEEMNYSGYGIYTFKPIISLLFIDRLNIISYKPELDSFTLLGTYLADIYLDFGFLGLILFNYLYGNVSNYVTKMFILRNSMQTKMNYCLILFIIIMFSFTNFFNTVFAFLCFIFINVFLYDRKDNES